MAYRTANKHTPGPWKMGAFDECGGYDCMTAGIRVGAAQLDGFWYGQARCSDISPEDKQRMVADARLIAAAPDLLAALEEVTRCLSWHVDNGRGVAMDAKAASDALTVIRKARGEA